MKYSKKYTSLKGIIKSFIKNNSSIGIGGHHFARLPIALIMTLLKNESLKI